MAQNDLRATRRERFAIGNLTGANVLQTVFIALFAQLQLILFTSLISPKPLAFVQKIRMQLDFEDFFQATADWLHGLDPYVRVNEFHYHRFNKPAPALLVALPLQHFSEAVAAHIFYLCNIAAIAASLWAICRFFKLSKIESLLVFGIGSMYFPLVFVVERGNLDGFMLGLISMSLVLKNPLLRGLSLGLSAGLKLYTLILIFPLIIARQWKLALISLSFFALLLLSFHSLFWPFIHTQMSRGAETSVLENLSPAGLFADYGNNHFVRIFYLSLWLISYACMLYRHRSSSLTAQMIYSLPWTMALPFEVLPYTGILLLPVLVLRSREMAAKGFLALHDYLFLAGFLFVGLQQTAMMEYFLWLTHSHRIFGAVTAFGTTLVIWSLALGPIEPELEPSSQTGESASHRQDMSIEPAI
jgi:hypothetical protein